MILKKLHIKITFFILLWIIAGSVFFSSCEKEDTTDFVNQAEITSQSLDLDIETIRLSMLFHKAIYDTTLMNHDTAIIDSAFVTSGFDSLTNERTFIFDYGDGQTSPDWKHRSGKIIALYNVDPTSAEFFLTADFNNYNFEGYTMEGGLSMSDSENSNEAGIRFTSTSNFQSVDENDRHFQQNGTKQYTWIKGFEKPDNWEVHEFLVSGSATALYQKTGEKPESDANLNTTIIDDWVIRLSCGKIINTGFLEVQFESESSLELITGDFVDADLDGCCDKVILKNSDNFGYPFYF